MEEGRRDGWVLLSDHKSVPVLYTCVLMCLCHAVAPGGSLPEVRSVQPMQGVCNHIPITGYSFSIRGNSCGGNSFEIVNSPFLPTIGTMELVCGCLVVWLTPHCVWDSWCVDRLEAPCLQEDIPS